MTPNTLTALETRLERFGRDLTASMGRRERRHWAQVSGHGLLLDGERKSVEPMASRIAGADVQALRQFVGLSPWPVAEVQRRLARKVVNWLRAADVWIIDETAFPKAGTHSVGVARQYCGTWGKVANCQVAISVHWSSAKASCPLHWRLYLPQAWVEHQARAAPGSVPPGTTYRRQTDVALDLIDQVRSGEVPARPVVAASCYGNAFGFRHALRQRQWPYAVEVEATTSVWTEDPNVPLPPPKTTGRPRRYLPLEALPRPMSLQTVAHQLPASAWTQVTWLQGSRGPHRSRLGVLQVWAAQGWREQRHPERVAEWLLVEWPQEALEPVKYWLAHFGSQLPGQQFLVSIAQSRWRIALDYRELTAELSLEHDEGRHWLGWHHPVCLVNVADALLRSKQARVKKNYGAHVAPGEEAPVSHLDQADRPLPLVPSAIRRLVLAT